MVYAQTKSRHEELDAQSSLGEAETRIKKNNYKNKKQNKNTKW